MRNTCIQRNGEKVNERTLMIIRVNLSILATIHHCMEEERKMQLVTRPMIQFAGKLDVQKFANYEP